MTIRERIEQQERDHLSPYAALSAESQGRRHAQAPCPVRTVFQRDRDRIIHLCRAFRRLAYKTQVFFSPVSDHLRTRLSHTLEVAQISRTIAKALRLNEDLAEAISLAHDVGHAPFGHAGRRRPRTTPTAPSTHRRLPSRPAQPPRRGRSGARRLRP